jgi:hypothetical protein
MMVYKYQTEWWVQKIDNDTLQKLITKYNNCPHGTAKQVPAELYTQQDPEIVKAARGEIKDHAKKLIAENQQKFPQLRIGDIRATLTKNSMFRLLGPDGKEIDRFFLRQDLQKVDPKKLQRELEHGEYVVEKVLAKKKIDGTLHYLVKFVGYPEPKWVKPQESFAKAIKKFQSKSKKQPKPQAPVPKAPVPKTPAKKARKEPPAAVTPPVVQTRSGRMVKALARYG